MYNQHIPVSWPGEPSARWDLCLILHAVEPLCKPHFSYQWHGKNLLYMIIVLDNECKMPNMYLWLLASSYLVAAFYYGGGSGLWGSMHILSSLCFPLLQSPEVRHSSVAILPLRVKQKIFPLWRQPERNCVNIYIKRSVTTLYNKRGQVMDVSSLFMANTLPLGTYLMCQKTPCIYFIWSEVNLMSVIIIPIL